MNMSVYDEQLEPSYDEKVDWELYEETKRKLQEVENENLGLKDDLEETKDDLKAVIETFIEFGYKYEFNEAYPKMYEFLKGRGLI